MKFKIGRNCYVDPAANQVIIKNGEGEQTAKLEPRMMRVLVLFAEQPGKVLRRESLIDAVWENKFVGEEALTQAISRLRKIFGDKAHQPQFIETIPKTGYRLIANIEWNHDRKTRLVNGNTGINLKRKTRFFTIATTAIVVLVFVIAAISMAHKFH